MKKFGKLIPLYILRAVLPYFFFSWILLSVILFVQQAGRFSDIFFNANLPANLIWQLTFALVPNVIAFTCPMAILVGVIIGLSKLQTDSELVAIRASGVGNKQILLPIAILGIILSFFALAINWKGVPFAAQVVRKIALQTALYKLQSPIEPGVFNTEISGFTVYVKSGNILSGEWEKIFIFNEDKTNGNLRLITSGKGRIDTTKDDSELVLNDATVSTFSTKNQAQPFVLERVNNLRFVIQTKRGEIIEKLSKTEETPEELGLSELAAFAKQKEGKDRIEAEILWQRRIMLSIAPLLFAMLGASLVLRFSRGGRGFGIFLALVSLISFYLLALLGEQLARTGKFSVAAGSYLPIIATILAITWFNFSSKIKTGKKISFPQEFKDKFSFKREKKGSSRGLKTFGAAILDFDIVLSILKYFALTVGFLMAIYLIFTAFELWKFAGTMNNGFPLLMSYLLYLLPFIYIQIAPSCLMIATLATFVIKSRQNEIVTWTAAGQSVYRLLLPCFLLMIFIGIVNWQIQERILPQTNRVQDNLRNKIRSRGVLATKEGKFWIADEKKIYAFETNESDSQNGKLNNFYLFDFSKDGENLNSFTKAESAIWRENKIELQGQIQKTTWKNNKIQSVTPEFSEKFVTEDFNPFKQIYGKPSHLNSSETKQKIAESESESEKRMYEVAFEKKYTTIFLPFIITLFTAPFALSISSRRGKVLTVGYSVAVWLLFMGISNTFEQYGLNGYLAPTLAIWSPLTVFAILGGFLLTRAKT